ncbi:MAG: S8 family serine peptidase [Chitinophagaceae bacterium]
MKKISLLLLAYFAINFCANSQQPIYLKTATVFNSEPSLNPTNNAVKFASSLFEGRYYLCVQFNVIPTLEQKLTLENTGVRFFDYLPKNTYFASFPANYNFNILSSFSSSGVLQLESKFKIDKSLLDPSSINWAYQHPDVYTIDVNFNPSLSKQRVIEVFQQNGISFSTNNSLLNDVLSVSTSFANIQKIASFPFVQYIEPIGAPPSLDDDQGISNHRNNAINTTDNYFNGKKLDGTGVTVVIGDDGFVGPHIDFTGRLENRATSMSAGNTHADHCSGIILGAPNFRPRVRGQAPGANLITYDGYADYNAYPSIYNNDNTRVTSHSLGQTCNSGYTSDARTSDVLINTYPLMNHVHSAGNSGNTSCGGISSGWRTITGGFKAGKNVITVANVTKADVLSSSSSKGPTADRRIKPDISAVGTSVTSTYPSNTYGTISGTSMACPAIAGSLAVLVQAYKAKFNNVEPNGALIKAIALNTADDIGYPGPDFSFGWGRINMTKAVKCVEDVRFLSGQIGQAALNTHEINIPSGVKTAKIMVYWNDVAANSGAAQALINDIDIDVQQNSNNTTTMPWLLDPTVSPDLSTIDAPATLGNDHLNNVEQVQLNNPSAGSYTLKVRGFNIPTGPQNYFVVIEYIMQNVITVTSPFGGESFVPGETERLRWDAPSDDNDFLKIEFSGDNGSTWQNLHTFVLGEAGSLRHLDWVVPNTPTAQGRIRVSANNNAYSDISDTTFVILGVPTGVSFTEVCTGRSTVSWNAVPGATGYDVFKLGVSKMELVGSTNTTSITLSNMDSYVENWWAVRAKMANRGAAGRRTGAVMHMNTSGVTCPPLPVKLISFLASIKNKTPQLQWIVASEINMREYIVERSNNPSFENPLEIGSLKPKNNFSSNTTYNLEDKTGILSGTYYYRLKMIDADKILYSNIQIVKLDEKAFEATIFPNPTKGSLFVSTNTKIDKATVEVFTQEGKRVLTQQNIRLEANVANNVSLQALSNGNYFIKVTNNKTGAIVAKQQITIMH